MGNRFSEQDTYTTPVGNGSFQGIYIVGLLGDYHAVSVCVPENVLLYAIKLSQRMRLVSATSGLATSMKS